LSSIPKPFDSERVLSLGRKFPKYPEAHLRAGRFGPGRSAIRHRGERRPATAIGSCRPRTICHSQVSTPPDRYQGERLRSSRRAASTHPKKPRSGRKSLPVPELAFWPAGIIGCGGGCGGESAGLYHEWLSPRNARKARFHPNNIEIAAARQALES